MPDPITFQKIAPEKEVMIKVTAKEAHMIKVIRSIPFGDITIKKAGGQVVRIEPKASILLEEKQGIEYAEGNNV